MIVRTYRLSAHQDNTKFFGAYKWLREVSDNLSEADIALAQWRATHDFLKTNIHQDIVRRLNADLELQGFVQQYNDEDNIVNRVWEKIESFYQTGAIIQKATEISPTALAALSGISSYLIQEYQAILNLINSSAQDNNNIIKSQILSTRLKNFDNEFKKFEIYMENISSSNVQLVGKNGYLNQLYVYDRMIKGYLLEEDIVKKALEYIPSQLKVEDQPFIAAGTGTLYVGGVQSGTDVLVFKKGDLSLNNLKVSYNVAPIGDPNNKTPKEAGLIDFLEEMESERGTYNFYIEKETFVDICKKAIMAIQAKASRPTADVKFKRNISWATIYNKFYCQEVRALLWMNYLYTASSALNKKSWYKQQTEQYNIFVNMALSKNFSFILGEENNFILTNDGGLETVGDFLLRKIRSGWLFKWQNGNRKTLNIKNLPSLVYDIVLTQK